MTGYTHHSAIVESIRRLLVQYPELEHDADFRRDVIEGQTSFAIVIERLVRETREIKGTIAGLTDAQAELGAKIEAKAKRNEAVRDAIAGMMEAAALDSFGSKSAKISFGAASKSVVVTDVDLLPDQYRKVTVTPIKTEIKRAIEAGVTVPGAELSNGQRALRIV